MVYPIAFFAYKRPYHTFLSLNSLSLNKEAKETELNVFIDGHRKISEIHKAVANLHIKTMKLESEFKVEKNKKKLNVRQNQRVDSNVRKEVIYRVPKKISGDLTMTHSGKSASVQATLKVKNTE